MEIVAVNYFSKKKTFPPEDRPTIEHSAESAFLQSNPTSTSIDHYIRSNTNICSNNPCPLTDQQTTHPHPNYTHLLTREEKYFREHLHPRVRDTLFLVNERSRGMKRERRS